MMSSSGFLLAIIGFAFIVIQIQSEEPIELDKKKLNCKKDGGKWNTCGGACDRTCSNHSPPKENNMCTMQCVATCDCPKGKLCNEVGGCTDEYKCTSCKAANTTYYEKDHCNPACKTCKTVNQNFVCKLLCKAGCGCKKDHIPLTDAKGSVCVRPQHCPSTKSG